MKATAQFDNAKHRISVAHDVFLINIRYMPFAEHAKAFHMAMRARFSQMHHTIGTDRGFDPIMSDA